ncbi:MAG: ABC transporter substrate-binding protein [Pseudonocardiaceae bacterium]
MTFQLRDGVRFSDGTPFTAEVAKAHVQRWTGNPDNSFVGIATNTASIDAPAECTLVLRLKQPYYPALQEFSYVRPVRFPSPTSLDASGAFIKPVGTGPYKLDSLSTTEIVLVRNDGYWGGRPNPDKMIFKVIPDSQARLAPEEAVQLRSQSQITLLSQPAETNLLLAFNLVSGNPALKDPKVREAINYVLQF